ncbi:MAG: hypothetical protein JWO48_2168 [Bryobacterales bacterium]|nr:hypothetical protein [Bryobacterales bacterium]
MARLAAVLAALARAFRRDQKSFQSVIGNNFFFISAYLLRSAGAFVYVIIGLVLLFPMSTDPLRKIPVSRLGLWPLDRRERWLLRAISPWINPLTWVLAALALWAAHGTVTKELWALAAGLFVTGFLVSSITGRADLRPCHGMWRRVPSFPGALNQLIRKNIREMLSTLDFYCGLLLSLSAIVYRAIGRQLPREAYLAITVLVVLALSSYAQCLFGLDGEGGLSRYRLLPLRGWQILAAKDAAFLLVTIPLTCALAPLAGIGAALVALALGHAPSVNQPRTQIRWRFSTGASLMLGFGQAILMAMAAWNIFSGAAWVILLCAAACAVSTWWYGRGME